MINFKIKYILHKVFRDLFKRDTYVAESFVQVQLMNQEIMLVFVVTLTFRLKNTKKLSKLSNNNFIKKESF